MGLLRSVPVLSLACRICSIALVLPGFFACAASAQESSQPAQDSEQQTAPTLTVTTHEVLLDVVVTDATGHAVTGLKASDFSVLEDGKPQAVASVQEHAPMSAEMSARLATGSTTPPNTFTNYSPFANTNAYTVILLDALNTRLDDQMSVRADLIKYLKHMQPGGPVAIFERDTKLRLVQGFTSDPQILLAAAEGARNRPVIANVLPGTREERLVYRAGNVVSGFQMMARYLAAYPGRKNLIWFTGSLPQADLSQPMQNPFGDEFHILEGNPRELTAALTLSRVAVYPIDARSLRVSTQYLAQSRRPVMPASTLAFDNQQGFQHITLDQIAESTGGRAYYSSNGLGSKIAEIERNGSDYYTLTYATTNKDWNGAFRHIKLEVNQIHGKLQYRQGYFAVDRTKAPPSPLDQNAGQRAAAVSPANAKETGVDAAEKNPEPSKEGFDQAMLLGAVPPTEVIFTARVAENDKVEQMKRDDPWPQDNYLVEDFKYKPFRTYTVDFNVDAQSLELVKGPDGVRRADIVFVTIVYDQTARNINSMLTTTKVELDEAQYNDAHAHGLTGHHTIAVPAAGNYFLRLGVHDGSNDRVGALELAVDQVKPETPLPLARSM